MIEIVVTYMNVLRLVVEANVNECSPFRLTLDSTAEVRPEESSRQDCFDAREVPPLL
jgi:hypothetical protein